MVKRAIDPRLRAFAAVVVLTSIVLGCTTGGAAVSPAPSFGQGAGPSASAAEPSASPAVTGPADVIQPVIADAATRAAVAATDVTVVEANARTWTTGALGCPSPGVMYTQQVVSGWQVIVEAGGHRYDYRASGPGHFKLCEGVTGG